MNLSKGDKIPVKLTSWSEAKLYEVVEVYPGSVRVADDEGGEDYLTVELRVVVVADIEEGL